MDELRNLLITNGPLVVGLILVTLMIALIILYIMKRAIKEASGWVLQTSPIRIRLEEFRISIAHPKLLSKRFPSRFLVQIYAPGVRQEVEVKIDTELGIQKAVEHIHESLLTFNNTVNIKLFSPEIVFSEPVIKKLTSYHNTAEFVGKPKDSCFPGSHHAILSITDERSGVEHQSIAFSLRVTDFAFDHVSRPFLSKTTAAILGIGSFVMFLLTMLEQIDTTFGLVSGTTVGALAGAVYFWFFSQYQKSNTRTYL